MKYEELNNESISLKTVISYCLYYYSDDHISSKYPIVKLCCISNDIQNVINVIIENFHMFKNNCNRSMCCERKWDNKCCVIWVNRYVNDLFFHTDTSASQPHNSIDLTDFLK